MKQLSSTLTQHYCNGRSRLLVSNDDFLLNMTKAACFKTNDSFANLIFQLSEKKKF